MTDPKINTILFIIWFVLILMAGVVGWMSRGAITDHHYIRAMVEREEAAARFYAQQYDQLAQQNQKLYGRDAHGKKTH